MVPKPVAAHATRSAEYQLPAVGYCALVAEGGSVAAAIIKKAVDSQAGRVLYGEGAAGLYVYGVGYGCCAGLYHRVVGYIRNEDVVGGGRYTGGVPVAGGVPVGTEGAGPGALVGTKAEVLCTLIFIRPHVHRAAVVEAGVAV